MVFFKFEIRGLETYDVFLTYIWLLQNIDFIHIRPVGRRIRRPRFSDRSRCTSHADLNVNVFGTTSYDVTIHTRYFSGSHITQSNVWINTRPHTLNSTCKPTIYVGWLFSIDFITGFISDSHRNNCFFFFARLLSSRKF